MSGFLGGSSGLIPATGNVVINFPGAYASLQAAVNASELYNYQNKWTFTVNAPDATYTGGICLPSLANNNYPASQYPSLVGDNAAPGNCVISNSAGDALYTSSYAFWSVSGFRLKSTTGTNADLKVQNYSSVVLGAIDFAGSGYLAWCNDYGAVNAMGATLTSSTTSALSAIYCLFYSGFINDTGTWTFNNSPAFSLPVLQIVDHSTLGYGTYVNGGTVTGNRLLAENYALVEYTGTRASLPGSGTVTVEDNSLFIGDTNSVLGGYTNTSTSLANTIALSDGAGNLGGDKGITAASTWTFGTANFNITSADTGATSLLFTNTSVGGHQFEFGSLGSANSGGVGNFTLFDNTAIALWLLLNGTNGSLNVASGCNFAWSSNSQGFAAADTGLSRESAGVLKVNNGSTGYGAIDASGYSASGVLGISATITTAKITPVTGTNGSMTFVNGILTAQTQAT
jgi:hypothetical protein